MSLNNIFREDLNNLTDEILANKILTYTNIDYENVPVIIEDAIKNAGFSIAVTQSFKREEIVIGIAHAETPFQPLKNDKFVIFKKDLDIKERRYSMAFALSSYVLLSNGEYYIRSIEEKDLLSTSDEREGRVARALLMPQKSLSTLIMSPLISKLDNSEKIANVSKAFLVPLDIAKKRLQETGL